MIRSIIRSGAALLHRLADHPLFAYVTILLLQLKVVWGMWVYRDLTFGDTSSYFVNAADWLSKGRIVFLWSPMYTLFYAAFLGATSDAPTATVLHRLAIVLVLAVLVLAVARRILPSPIAWITAAWWVTLPVTFDTLYEVHIFALVPLLCAYLIVMSGDSERRRGCALAVLVLSAFLMRNEYFLIVLVFAAVVGIYEWKRRRERTGRAILIAYGAPLLLVVLVVSTVYSKASDRGRAFSPALSNKHTLNVCQVFAFGYQQRHPEWQKSPWTECQELMVREFGRKQPTLGQAVAANPSAMAAHFLWNASLIPSGLQVLLFSRASGEVNPDYPPVVLRSGLASFLTVLLLAVWVLGAWRIAKNRQVWSQRLRAQSWRWIIILSPLPMTVVVMLTQRPRPSYLFSLGFFLMMATALAAYAIIDGTRAYSYLHRALPAIAVLAILLAPCYFQKSLSTTPYSLSLCYRRLAPYEDSLRRPRSVFLAAQYPTELCNYSGLGACRGIAYAGLRPEVRAVDDWASVLDRHKVTLIYADHIVMGDPMRPPMLNPGASAPGWHCLAYGETPAGRWMLWERMDSALLAHN